MADHIITGQKGEGIACSYLQDINYEIIERNVQLGHDEIDIIALDPTDKVIVFCEVKTRKSFNRNYMPSLNLTRDKKECMRRAARRWVANKNYLGGYRLDLICVAAGKVVDHLFQIGIRD